MTIDIGLSLFEILMALAAITLFVPAMSKSPKAAGADKGLPTPPFIFGWAFMAAVFVAQLAHFIVRWPVMSVSIAAAAMSFAVIVLILFKLAWHYRKLYRIATGQAS